MENFLVHASDDAGKPTGEPLYSGDFAGCLRYVNESGVNSHQVVDSETSAAIVAALKEQANDELGP